MGKFRALAPAPGKTQLWSALAPGSSSGSQYIQKTFDLIFYDAF